MKTLLQLCVAAGLAGSLLIGCGDDSGAPGNDLGGNKPDLAMTDDAGGGNPDMAPACVMNPMTHVEIINACTNADTFDKMPFYPMLAPNGMLPALP